MACSLTFFLTALLAFNLACKREEKFPELGKKLAGPIDVAVTTVDGGQHFYVFNTDFDRIYNQGSLSVLDTAGTIVNTIETKRLGRNMVLAGARLLLTYDIDSDRGSPRVELWDATDPVSPVLKKEFSLPCSPLNASIKSEYRHFVVTCEGGTLFLGDIPDGNLAGATLKRVRNYRFSRRALYVDAERELIIAFPYDINGVLGDALKVDATTYDAAIQEVLADDESKIRNEIPDDYESTELAFRDQSRRRKYQFIVYDIAAERDSDVCPDKSPSCSFPFRNVDDEIVKLEHRFIHYRTNNFDGTPDISDRKPDEKYYRTNFWTAKEDPKSASAFYVSQRGIPTQSPHANHVIHVRIKGSLRVQDGVAPKTEDVLAFERVYGFQGATANPLHFPGDFEIANIDGTPVIIVNNFKDLTRVNKDQIYFSVVAQTLGNNLWFAETQKNNDPKTSYFQLAVNPDGIIITASYYGNAVILLDLEPGIAISVKKRVESGL
jgi:hypothetical protein